MLTAGHAHLSAADFGKFPVEGASSNDLQLNAFTIHKPIPAIANHSICHVPNCAKNGFQHVELGLVP
jgi:hypothetical protein